MQAGALSMGHSIHKAYIIGEHDLCWWHFKHFTCILLQKLIDAHLFENTNAEARGKTDNDV